MRFSLLIGFAIVCCVSSCDQAQLFEKNVDIAPEGWHKDTVLRFEPLVTDTLSAYNVYINFRHRGKYPYMNIIFFVTISSPTGQQRIDTVEYFIAANDGRWLGIGFNDVYSHQLVYKKNIRFPRSGEYCISLQQAMRMDILPFVHDAGIRIEKVITP